MSILISGSAGIDMGNLPVSNASQVEVQEKQVSPFNGFKNYIINGNFDIWQYGVSQTTSVYGSDDRWFNGNNGTTKTHSQIACTNTERVLFNASKFSRTVVSSVVGASNSAAKKQLIEDVSKLAGKTVTLSFWARADSNKNIWLEFKQNFGTGGSPSALVTGLYGQAIALTSTWQKKIITFTLPSIVGKTVGTDGVHTSSTELQFWFDVGSASTGRIPTGIQQSGTFDIAQVQLEEGSVATPFENRPYGLELLLCQRYLPSLKQATFCIPGQAVSSTDARFVYIPIVQPRVPPTGLLITSGNGVAQILNAGGLGRGTSAPSTIWFSSVNGIVFTGTVASGLTAGDACLGNTENILFTGCEL